MSSVFFLIFINSMSDVYQKYVCIPIHFKGPGPHNYITPTFFSHGSSHAVTCGEPGRGYMVKGTGWTGQAGCQYIRDSSIEA